MKFARFAKLSVAAAVFSFAGAAAPVLAQPVSNGWTVLNPSGDSRMIYVSSSSGNDANSGLSPSAPKRTLAAGYALLRDGYPDWLNLKRGDTFNETLDWHKGGRSETEKMMMTAYGTGERPLLLTGSESAIDAWGGTDLNHVGFVSIAMKATSWNGSGTEPAGFRWVRPGTDMLIEDCYIEGYANSIIIQGYPGLRTNTKIRRNVLVDPLRLDPNNGSTNLYMGQYDGVLVEENVMDNSKAHEAAGAMLSHNIYMGEDNTSNNVVRGNIAHNGGRSNFNQRSGGLIENNLSIRGAMGITVGINYAPTWVNATLRDNCVIESRDNQNGQYLGFGIKLDKVDGIDCYNNLVANSTDGRDHKAISLEANVLNVNVHDNVVYKWQTANPDGWDTVKIAGQPMGQVRIQNNKFQQPSNSRLVNIEASSLPSNVSFTGNKYWSARTGSWFRNNSGEYTNSQWNGYESGATYTQVNFTDANRTISSYMSSIGNAGNTDQFMTEARKQSKTNWRTQYTAASVNSYLRGGFNMPGGSGGTTPTPCRIDVNGDGLTNINDYNAFLNAFMGGSPIGDFNQDGNRNILDFNAFQNAFQVGCN